MTGPHYGQFIPYSVVEVLTDLLDFSARMLVQGGRLIYWLPTTNEYKDTDLPAHPCFIIKANSEQPLTKRWKRRLITMEKIVDFDPKIHTNVSVIILFLRCSLLLLIGAFRKCLLFQQMSSVRLSHINIGAPNMNSVMF